MEARENFWQAVIPMAISLGVVGILLLAEPDMGAFLVIAIIAMGILFLGGVNGRMFLIISAVLVGAFVLMITLSEWRRERIFAYLNPWDEKYTLGKAYQLSHSLIAFGRGEIFGQGLGSSIEKLHYLPEAHTDFLLAVIGEELGFVGVAGVIFAFFWLARRLFHIGRQAIGFEQTIPRMNVEFAPVAPGHYLLEASLPGFRPLRHELGVSSGTGALGPYAHANATIARAYTLLSQNLQGGSEAGLTYFGSQGNPASYVVACFGETRSEARESRSTRRAASPGIRAPSPSSAASARASSAIHTTRRWDSELASALAALELGVTPVLVLDPLAAACLCAVRGFSSREALAAWVAEHTTRPACRLWPTFEGRNLLRQRAALGEPRWAAALDASPSTEIQLCAPEEVAVLVTGGETLGTYRAFGATPVVTVGVDAWR
jgi:hypothetical protein